MVDPTAQNEEAAKTLCKLFFTEFNDIKPKTTYPNFIRDDWTAILDQKSTIDQVKKANIYFELKENFDSIWDCNPGSTPTKATFLKFKQSLNDYIASKSVIPMIEKPKQEESVVTATVETTQKTAPNITPATVTSAGQTLQPVVPLSITTPAPVTAAASATGFQEQLKTIGSSVVGWIKSNYSEYGKYIGSALSLAYFVSILTAPTLTFLTSSIVPFLVTAMIKKMPAQISDRLTKIQQPNSLQFDGPWAMVLYKIDSVSQSTVDVFLINKAKILICVMPQGIVDDAKMANFVRTQVAMIDYLAYDIQDDANVFLVDGTWKEKQGLSRLTDWKAWFRSALVWLLYSVLMVFSGYGALVAL